ncbi:hypothetical protein GJ496_000430 [Pomphorhynchus laevis]|nr:hypothetical protein GJ496_000430 [Pomphorhynchus laevis]
MDQCTKDGPIHFLDAEIYYDNDTWLIRPYRKPTWKPDFLQASSHHAPQIKRNIILNEAIRLKKLFRNDIFEKALNNLYAHLQRRGYFHRQIETQFARARRRNRNDLLMPSKTKDTTTNMTCIPYHAALR